MDYIPVGDTATPGAKADLERDKAAQGLDESQIKNISLSIETGQVHNIYETEEMMYGADPRLSNIAKQRRKNELE